MDPNKNVSPDTYEFLSDLASLVSHGVYVICIIQYNGYTSCPLMVTKKTCIMAEFGYDGKILETFPINQSKPRWSMSTMKKILMPLLYWEALVK